MRVILFWAVVIITILCLIDADEQRARRNGSWDSMTVQTPDGHFVTGKIARD